MNLYGFVLNDGMNMWDFLGERAIKNPGMTGLKLAFVYNGTAAELEKKVKEINDLSPDRRCYVIYNNNSTNGLSGECATACQYMCCIEQGGEKYDVPSTLTWKEGDVVDPTKTPEGILVAKGWDENGHYKNKNKNEGAGNHAAIYLGPSKKRKGYCRMFSQNSGTGRNGVALGEEEFPCREWNIVTSDKSRDNNPTKCSYYVCPKSENVGD